MAIWASDTFEDTPTSGQVVPANHETMDGFVSDMGSLFQYTSELVAGYRSVRAGGSAASHVFKGLGGRTHVRMRWIAKWLSATGTAGHHFMVMIATSTNGYRGDTQIRNTTGTPVFHRWNFAEGSTTVAWPADTPWRFELEWTSGTSSILRIWTNPDSSGSPDYTITVAASNTDIARFCWGSSNGTSGKAVFFSQVAFSDGEAIGPVPQEKHSEGGATAQVSVSAEGGGDAEEEGWDPPDPYPDKTVIDPEVENVFKINPPVPFIAANIRYRPRGTKNLTTIPRASVEPEGAESHFHPRGSGVLQRSTVWSSHGQHSLRVSSSGTANDVSASLAEPVGSTDTGSVHPPFQRGITYTVSATIHIPAILTGTLHGRARQLAVYTRVGTANYVVFSQQAPNEIGTYRLSVTFTVPANASETFVRLYHGAAQNNGFTYWDNIMIEEGSTLSPFELPSDDSWTTFAGGFTTDPNISVPANTFANGPYEWQFDYYDINLGQWVTGTETFEFVGSPPKHSEGGATASALILPSGAGTRDVGNGTELLVEASATGGGVKSSEGGATASVVVSAEGGGEALERVEGEGGSTAYVSVTAEGGGEKDSEGFSYVDVHVTAEGGGVKETEGFTTDLIRVNVTGGGTKDSWGGSMAYVSVSADGGGTAEQGEQNYDLTAYFSVPYIEDSGLAEAVEIEALEASLDSMYRTEIRNMEILGTSSSESTASSVTERISNLQEEWDLENPEVLWSIGGPELEWAMSSPYFDEELS